jgi:hypothetical protein
MFMGRLAKRAKRVARALGALALMAGLASQAWSLSVNEDPNDPMANRDERIRRQEEMIQKALSGANRAPEPTPNPDASPPSEQQAPPPKINARPPGPMPAGLFPGRAGRGPRPAVPPPGAKKPQKSTARNVMLPYATFFLNPSAVVANVGERFLTRSSVLNAASMAMDEIQVVLAYNPDVLKPTAIYQDRIRPLLEGQPTVALDERAGLLIYRARLAKPNGGVDLATISVQWEALRPALATTIRTGMGDQYSGPFFRGKFLATNTIGVDTAQLGAVVRVDARGEGLPMGLAYNDDATTMALQGTPAPPSRQDPSRPPRLWIDQPASGELQPGQWLVIDIGVDNPGLQPIDEARLACAYDPDAVELIDADRHNLISDGSNVLDGPFRSFWPWNMLYVDKIDQARGTFYYRMTTQQPVARRAAPLARLLARVKAPTQAPLLHWIWNGDADVAEPQTGLFAMGRNLYSGVAKLDEPTQAAVVQAMEADDQPGYEKADPKAYRF